MYHLQGDQLVIGRATAGDEEEGGISTIDDFAVCGVAVLSVYEFERVKARQQHLCTRENCTFECVWTERVEKHL